MLLKRESLDPILALERLAGLQAQLPMAPYVGLWTRLERFDRDSLARLLEERHAVKATTMRGTLHLVSARDYARFRATLQPMLTAGWAAIARGRAMGFDISQVLAETRVSLSEKPRTFAEISRMLSESHPGMDVGAMRYAVRTHLPLVQVPTSTRWSYPGNPQFALAESWMNQPLSGDSRPAELIRRYLAAFGPANAADMQTWSGLAGTKELFEEMRPELLTLRDQKGREMFDLPDSPRPPGTTPAPPRFLPEYDNLLLSHNDRSRVVPQEYRSNVYLPGLRVAATILVDGEVRGVWKIEKSGKSVMLVIEPFAPLCTSEREELAAEGERLAQFIEPDAETHAVTFVNR
jgi:hypothetical protein